MSQSDDPIRQLLEWEQDARRLVDEANAQAQAVQDEAKRQCQDRLVRAQQEAKTAAEQRRAKILEETEPVCRTKRETASRDAASLQAAAAPRIDDAAQAALRWLLFYEEVERVRRRTIR